MEDTQKSFDELKKFSKTLHEAEMFILGSILKMRRGGGDKDWEGDLELTLTARNIKAISKGLDCKLKKNKDSYQKRRKQNLEKKIRQLEPEMSQILYTSDENEEKSERASTSSSEYVKESEKVSESECKSVNENSSDK